MAIFRVPFEASSAFANLALDSLTRVFPGGRSQQRRSLPPAQWGNAFALALKCVCEVKPVHLIPKQRSPQVRLHKSLKHTEGLPVQGEIAVVFVCVCELVRLYASEFVSL